VGLRGRHWLQHIKICVRFINILNYIIDALSREMKKMRSDYVDYFSAHHFTTWLVAYNRKVTTFFAAFGWFKLGG